MGPALVALLRLAVAKDMCLPGSFECKGNVLRSCDLSGKWINIKCPRSTECRIEDGEASCLRRDGVRPMDILGDMAGKKKNSGDRRKSGDGGSPSREDGDREPGTGGGGKSPGGGEDNGDDKPEMNSRSSQSGGPSDGDSDPDEAPKKAIQKPKEEKGPDSSAAPRKTKTVYVTKFKYGKKDGGDEDDSQGEKSPKKQVIYKTVTAVQVVKEKISPTEIKFEYMTPPGVMPYIGSMPMIPAVGQPPGGKSGGGGASGGASGGGDSGGTASGGAGGSGGSAPGGAPSGGDSGGSASSGGGSGGSAPGGAGGEGASGGGDSSAGGGSSSSASSDASAGASSGSSGGGSGGSTSGSSSDASAGSSSQSGSDSGGGSSAGSDAGSKASSDASSSSGGGAISEQQLNNAMKTLGFQPKPEYAKAVIKITNENIKDKNEAAMFLAQLAHESGGYKYIEEIACSKPGSCQGKYGTGVPGKSYHGRGFIQLSWPENYKAAGKGLGMGDKLYQNPDQVAKDATLGAKVSYWFWKNKVVSAPGVKGFTKFGATTKAINGALECKGQNVDKSKKRYAAYKALAKELKISKPASESGCYS